LREQRDGERERQCQRAKQEAATLPKERRQRWARLVGAEPLLVARPRLGRVHPVPLSCIHPLGLA